MLHRRDELLLEARKKQQLIGVWGTGSGCGATHMAIATAIYAKQVWNHKVAYVEFNALNQIVCLLGDEEYWQEEFFYQGVRFFANVTQDKLWKILEMGYETLVLDLGTRGERIPKEFSLCHIKLIVADGAKWKRNALEALLKKLEKEEVRQCRFLISFAGKQEVKRLRRDYRIHFYPIPYQQDAFCLNLPMIELLETLI